MSNPSGLAPGAERRCHKKININNEKVAVKMLVIGKARNCQLMVNQRIA
jgi:hypothetical protein